MRKMRNNGDQRVKRAQRGEFKREGGGMYECSEVGVVEHEVSYREMRTDWYKEQETKESFSAR